MILGQTEESVLNQYEKFWRWSTFYCFVWFGILLLQTDPFWIIILDQDSSYLFLKILIFNILFVLIFARTNFRAFTQKSPFVRENQYTIYAEKGSARNLIRAKIISFHLIHFEPFQKLLFWFKGNICFFIRFKKNWHARKLMRAKKTYITVARKLVHAKISTNKVF